MPPHLDPRTQARPQREHRTWEGARADPTHRHGAPHVDGSRVRRLLALSAWATLLWLAQAGYEHSGLAAWVQAVAHAHGLPLQR